MSDLAPLPERLRIGPYTWTVSNSKKNWDRGRKDSRLADDADGWTDLLARRIGIRPKLHLEYERVVLLHEILHACLDSSHHATLDLNDAEESLIRYISPVLYGVLQDNPDLLDYLGLT